MAAGRRITAWSVLFVFILILIPNVLFAQTRPFPYELKKKDYWLLPLGAGLATLGISLQASQEPITLEEILTLDRNNVNAFDRPATFNWSPEWGDRSDFTRDILVFSSLIIMTAPPVIKAEWTKALTVATMFAESSLLLAGVTSLTKVAVGRKRPYLYNTDLPAEERLAARDDPYSSFFSGHTSTAFMAAAFLSKVFNDIHGPSIWSKLVWGTSLSLAALTGFARVKASMHYPSDVIAGAAVGFAIGYLIPTLHKKKWGDRVSIAAGPHFIILRLKF